ncbi:hypothetical protein B0F90DRAFT_1771046 [Multifurca ochricompacta]|uniref:F-box domain-containing protein n=1 Tax=Multifurca ochricompacta TaxID=376703 RepID=A0AAD4LY48_9AGAM|nr:hypothetical protein B0F90DRAFT_1771046 [Multifurca ochricompacta]
MSLLPSLGYYHSSRDFTTATTRKTSLPSSAGRSSNNLGRNNLPNEILNAIFDYLSSDTLTCVALVSRRCPPSRVSVSPCYCYYYCYYSGVGAGYGNGNDNGYDGAAATSTAGTKLIRNNLRTMPAVPAITLRCCETLSSHPHLAKYVRRFHVRWQTDSVESPVLLFIIAQNITKTLVPTLVHLYSLELSFGLSEYIYIPSPSPSPTPTPTPLLVPSPSLSSPPPPQTPLHGTGGEPPPELVLRNHPTLLHLKLGDCYHRPIRLQPADIPHLRSFRGCPTTAASILPGRPVQVLSLVGYEFVTEENLACIAAGSLPVRSLDLSSMCVTPNVLRNVSRHYPTLNGSRFASRFGTRSTTHSLRLLSNLIMSKKKRN